MKKLRLFAVVLMMVVLSKTSFSQSTVNVKDSIVFVPMIMPIGGFHFPLGDVQQVYKFTYHVGGQFLIKDKHNWMYGVSGSFMFGENVGVPELMSNIYPIYDQSGAPPGVSLGMRGFNFMAQGGKIVPIGKKPNRNSGLMFMFGAGFLQHKINIEFRGENTPQAKDDYLKGYDRLHYGFAMSQFIGYQYLGNNKSLNFFAGVEFIEGFTRNRRIYNYDTQSYDTRDKYDIFIGLKVGYIFPIYRRGSGPGGNNKDKEYYYK